MELHIQSQACYHKMLQVQLSYCTIVQNVNVDKQNRKRKLFCIYQQSYWFHQAFQLVFSPNKLGGL